MALIDELLSALVCAVSGKGCSSHHALYGLFTAQASQQALGDLSGG